MGLTIAPEMGEISQVIVPPLQILWIDLVTDDLPGLFSNKPLLWAALLTFVLQLAVIYVLFSQDLFKTVGLSPAGLAISLLFSTVVFWGVEIEKWFMRRHRKSDLFKDTTWSTTTRILVIIVLLAVAVRIAFIADPLLQMVGISAQHTNYHSFVTTLSRYLSSLPCTLRLSLIR